MWVSSARSTGKQHSLLLCPQKQFPPQETALPELSKSFLRDPFQPVSISMDKDTEPSTRVLWSEDLVSPLPLRGGRPQGRALCLWSWQGWVTYLPQASQASFIKWEWLYLPYLPCVALKTSNYPMTRNVMKYKHHEGGQSHREKPSLELREKHRRPRPL